MQKSCLLTSECLEKRKKKRKRDEQMPYDDNDPSKPLPVGLKLYCKIFTEYREVCLFPRASSGLSAPSRSWSRSDEKRRTQTHG
jgi:hypothetical protein